jgi:hypothetical protein
VEARGQFILHIVIPVKLYSSETLLATDCVLQIRFMDLFVALIKVFSIPQVMVEIVGRAYTRIFGNRAPFISQAHDMDFYRTEYFAQGTVEQLGNK